MLSPFRNGEAFLPWPVGRLLDRRTYGTLVTQHRGEYRYEHGWPFVAQYLRRGGWIYRERESAAVIVRDRNGLPRLVTFFGTESAGSYVAIAETFGREMIVENVPEAISQDLCQMGRWSYIEEIPSLDERPESTYPQIAVQLTRISCPRTPYSWTRKEDVELSGVRSRFIRDAKEGFRSLTRSGGHLVPWEPSYLPQAIECVRASARWHAERVSQHGAFLKGGERSLAEPVEFVLNGFAHLMSGPVAMGAKGIVGFALTLPVDAETIGVYANGSIRDVKNAMDLLFASCVAELVSSASASRLLLGGSETSGLYRFKKKIGTVAERPMRALRYWPS